MLKGKRNKINKLMMVFKYSTFTFFNKYLYPCKYIGKGCLIWTSFYFFFYYRNQGKIDWKKNK